MMFSSVIWRAARLIDFVVKRRFCSRRTNAIQTRSSFPTRAATVLRVRRVNRSAPEKASIGEQCSPAEVSSTLYLKKYSAAARQPPEGVDQGGEFRRRLRRSARA